MAIIDAANDSHSGYTLYRILAAMAAAMSPAPLLTWYSFDFVGSALDSETGRAWVPNNPNYDPGPVTRVRVVREDDDLRRKRKGRKGGAHDGPTASNVSAMAGPSSGVGHGPRMSNHQPLFRPPPHIGPSRYVTSIRSPGQQPDDVPLFVSRDSPDYEKYRSLGEANVCLVYNLVYGAEAYRRTAEPTTIESRRAVVWITTTAGSNGPEEA